jgi:hypothetical protein
MEPPQRSKSNPTPPSQSAAGSGKSPPKDTRPGAPSQSPRPSYPDDPIPSGRVLHDDRGNAVWDWLKETGRNAIGTTSRLLKKLELSHLKVEEKKDEELRIQEDRDPGGGYDPYNQATKPPGGPRRKGP